MTNKRVPKPPVKKPSPPSPEKEAKTYVLFGADEYAKPRGARFAGDDASLLAKAAETMCLRLVEVTGEELTRLAPKLPVGRLNASGPALVPFIKGDLYLELVIATVGEQEPLAEADFAKQKLPRSWDDVQPGHLVIAKEGHECGWWEAIVLERKDDCVALKYRDYPTCPKLVRHRSAIALISIPADQKRTA